LDEKGHSKDVSIENFDLFSYNNHFLFNCDHYYQ